MAGPQGKRPGLGTLLMRGVRKRCAKCGQGRAFESYFRIRQRCPHCGYIFEREEGYWVGAVIINFVFVEGWFLLLFVAIVFATAPDIAWVQLLVVGLVTNGLLPVVLYPHSKTIWMALDLHLHRT